MTQDDYILILFNNLGFDLLTRRSFLEDNYGVSYVDELPKVKKSELITYLRDQQE
jgi:hypothetical protein